MKRNDRKSQLTAEIRELMVGAAASAVAVRRPRRTSPRRKERVIELEEVTVTISAKRLIVRNGE